MARVLRGHAAPPHRFAPLPAAAAVPAFEPLAFEPLAFGGPAAPPVSSGEAAADAEALDAAFEAGREAGRAGRDDEVAALRADVERLEAEAAARAEADAATGRAAERLAGLWEGGIRGLEPALAALAIETAEALLSAPLSGAQRAAADQALAEAVDAVAGAAPLSVRLHPVDLLHLQESGLADALSRSHGGLRWEPDNTLAEGDWTATTPEAAVHRLTRPMLGALRERLGVGGATGGGATGGGAAPAQGGAA